MTTLRHVCRDHWLHFHRHINWYLNEPFMDAEVPTIPLSFPDNLFTGMGAPATNITGLPYAAHLALLYVFDPTHPMWTKYIWCADKDSHGQRVYVGQNGLGLEIHRHLHLTDRWIIPAWGAL